MTTMAQREASAKRSKQYRKSNLEKVRAVAKEYRVTHPEKIRAKNEKYYTANCEKMLMQQKQRRNDSSGKVQAQRREWYRTNPGRGAAQAAARRAMKLRATPSWLNTAQKEVIEALYAAAQVTKMHVDHIVPLQGENVSGLHVPWNLQLLQPEANMSKGNRFTTA